MKTLPFHSSPTPRVRLVEVEQAWTVCEATPISMPAQAFAFLVPYFVNKDRERFVALHLDASHRPISAEVISVGVLNSAPVHPREVFKAAILANACAIVVAHNHPSGDLSPSVADRDVHTKLKDAGEILGIRLLDFLIVGPGQFLSLSDG